MKNTNIKHRESEKGFTLVELAVVMIIIGILVGGIIKGQELIVNARLTSTASQLQALGAAHNGFFDQYNALPGDMNNAVARLSNCVAANGCVNGNLNNEIDVVVGAAQGNESIGYFGHLNAAGFIKGMSADTNAAVIGRTLPTAPIGGGFNVGDGREGAPTGFAAATIRPAPHIWIQRGTAALAAGSGVLTPTQAGIIDTRLDDGGPTTGGVIAQNTASTCSPAAAAGAAAGPAIYGGPVNQVCVIAYRL